jgi:hypothetical protein
LENNREIENCFERILIAVKGSVQLLKEKVS